MKSLWLLKGDQEAAGWKDLESDSKADKIDLVIFDRAQWALVYAEEPPTEYEGLVPCEPRDGLYVSEQGYPAYVVDGREVASPLELIKALGPEAEELSERLGDPVAALQKLGRAY